MALTATWLRTVSGALCALLLLVFTIAPAVESVICASEDAPSVSVPSAFGDVPTRSDHGEQPPFGKAGADVCAHGHCHHGASAVPVFGAVLAVKTMVPLALAPGAGGVPPSNRPEAPSEPPRA